MKPTSNDAPEISVAQTLNGGIGSGTPFEAIAPVMTGRPSVYRGYSTSR
jgi:hypothetical protein